MDSVVAITSETDVHDPGESTKDGDNETHQSKVKYMITCCDFKLGRMQQYQSDKNPFENKQFKQRIQWDSAVLEVFVEATGLGGSDSWTPDTRQKAGRPIRHELDERRLLDTIFNRPSEPIHTYRELNEATLSFKASDVRITAVHIHSHRLQDLLRSMSSSYPIPSLNADPIIIEHPLKILMHNFEKLLNLVPERPDRKLGENSSTTSGSTSPYSASTAMINCDEEMRNDLNVLLDFLTPIYSDTVEPFKKRQDAGLVTYDRLWFLFVRGSYVYSSDTGQLQAYIFADGEYTTSRANPSPAFCVSCYRLSNGGRRMHSFEEQFEIRFFTGERDIVSLPVFLAEFHDSKHPSARSEMESIRKRYYKYIHQMPSHMKYSGPARNIFLGNKKGTDPKNAINSKKPNQYEGEVVLDQMAYYQYSNDRGVVFRLGRESDNGTKFNDNYSSCPPDLISFNPNERETVQAHEYLLFPRRIGGYAIRDKAWLSFDVEYFSDIEWQSSPEDILNRIILPPRDIEMIQALAQPFKKGQPDFWGADFIAGKGEGQIFLLHGPPGTGKTYTVECVAESTRRPLLSLTVADIGTDEYFYGVWNTTKAFYSWFTTNRVGHIDDAFLSRTSIVLTYPPLSIDSQRRIWENFIKKLKKERTDIVITYRAIKSSLSEALQTAIAFARYQAETSSPPSEKIEVDEEHFFKVLDRKRSFWNTGIR
ncbi:hypothetical protein N431DRAFT_458857 [Stipitochalara longipes BDJ]|nr:hypothetical protein N431DRAFT_458857 [Stipitochalara longipes BDJ]